ncbi:E3 ubiquitin-protein ligase UPL1-like isoform X1 [Chenopodium quinoa]|uniref:E3 ubiquitin-protein ligase UPL1-like isoform X1 n=1 Tax=Chenopodium quinoa TaxID=63459 RepID=UPI000B77A2FB|nr:E3 ubiquitin-protein ligase UPL1-like isoform X1 [Chenopodium quinoa]XP_021771402.1 E3 ubiquitin-protein ligase UPL1-like isoform X1 [Chenopodium quinoa]
MKLKRRRASEVPPKIRLFINSVTSTPLENIQEPLKGFVWDFDKGDFHHWVDLFNHFDSYFEKHIKPRKDLCFEDDFLECDPPFPREAVLQILRVMRIILENCTNKHFLSCYEQHLSSLMASADADVVEASLQTLATFLKKTVGKYSIRDASLSSRLLSFAQGWGCKEEGLGLTACTLENGCDTVAYELGRTLHFEFYRVAESSTEYEATGGLQIIHVPDVISRKESDLELLNMLVKEYGVPLNLRFSLFTRLRFARAFGSLASRQQYTCIRLYAFVVLIQASSDADDLTSFFNTEPEFTNELVSLLSYEDLIPEKIRTLSLRSLVALSQDRTRQPTVLAAVTSGGQRGILSSLMQKAIDSVSNGSSKWSVVFAEALLSLVTILVSSSSGCSAMREAGFIPTLLPLLKDTDPQHLHLVGTAVHVLEAFMDYSNPAVALFRDLGGLDETINRLKVEVSVIENGLQQSCGNSDSSRTSTEVIVGTSAVLDDIQPLYSESLLAHHRRLLMKALLRAINLGTYAPGSTDRIYGSEESLLPQCLCIIFRKAKDFGGGVFSLAATVMSDLIHKDPTCFSVLDAAGLPSAFMDAIMDGVVCSADAITCIPQCLDALCLNNNGLQAVKDRNALSCFVKIFTSKAYLRALAGDAPGALSSGLDELMRHAATLREPGVDILIEILNTILKLGSADDSSPSVDSLPCPAPVPMGTDSDVRSLSSPDERESQKTGSTDLIDLSSDATVVSLESYLPDCVSNACRLLETILQNSDACRLFFDKKGVEAVLQMFTLPLLPVSVSVGQSVSTAFKNFSAQHSASLAKAVCAFLKEHLNTTIEVIDSIEGTPIASLESAKQTKVTRCLSSLEGLLSLSNSLLKGTTTLVSELGAGDADVLKDIGRVYREVLWQISLSCDTKAEQKQNVEVETENAEAASSTAAGRESDEDAGIPVVRYMNPVSIRSGSQSQWAGERDFLSVIRSGEGLSRRNRHSLTRIRGGRTDRHLDSFNMDSDVSANVQEPSSSLEHKKKSPDVLASDILSKLSATMRSFYTALIKGISSPNRRRADSGVVSSVAKNVGTVLAKIFLEALSFSGYSSPTGLEMSLSVKCRYLGKVVHDMAALTFDSRRRICHTAMVNNFYVNGSFKELMTTFEATSQLLWSLPHSIPISGVDPGKVGEGSKLDHNSWLLDTLQCYCRLLEYFVNSSLLLSPTSPSQAQLLVQPVAVGLSIGLFPVPRDPEVFVRMLQSQVLDVILPVWNHPMFPHCSASFITSVLSLVTHIYSGVGDLKRNRSGVTGSSNQRVAPPPDEATISTIVEMGFSRARAEEALRRVESNSVEMAMDWLCTHAEDPVHEEDELAQALALSLGSSAETSKSDNNDKSVDVQAEEGQMKVPPVDDILGAAMKLFQSGDSLAFPLTDLLATLCNRNKGEDRLKVASYLIQQLKLCSSDLSKDASAVSSISHILALLLSEDADAREIAAQNGIVSVAIDILKNSRSNQLGKDVLSTKSTSALLLILDNLLQSRPKFSSANAGIASTDPLPDSSEEHASVEASVPENEGKLKSGACEEESVFAFEKIFGKSTGHLSMNECHSVLEIACDMLKQQVPAVIMQAVLQLCARLTKTHALALQFLENGGMAALFDLPRSCFFAGYDTLASAIVRHLLEDPQTLQTAMELEIRQTLSGGRHAGRIPTRIFLTSMAPVISRDPVIFTKAATAVCQLESSAGRTVVVLSKEKEKEKERSKVTGATEGALSSNEPIRISETKVQDGPGKGSKGHKKIPVNLAQVIDQLLEIILQFPCSNIQEDCTSYQAAMEVDEPGTSMKGKSKIDEATKGDSVVLPESSAALAKVIFVLKLLSDILLMYVHAISVVLKRDSEICQLRVSSQLDSPGQGGIVHHVLHKLLPLSSDKSSKPGDLRAKLSEKASWFLVVLCGRSSEGRRRVISELVKALSLYTNLDSNSLQSSLLPDRKVLAFVELAYSVLSKNASSSSLSVSGYSPDIARGLIDGGIVPCLSSILQAIDLDHPDASKIANLILKALESLTRAANASEQSYKSDVQNKKKSNGSQGRSDDQTTNAVVNDNTQHNDNRISEQEAGNAQVDGANPHEGAGFTESTHGTDVVRSDNQDVRAEGEGMQVTNATVELAMEFPGDEMEEGDLIHNSNRIGMEFHVEHRADEGVGDEDDDMGGEGEEEEDEEDDDGEDEDEDIAEDGTALMSLADTDVDDHEDAGFGDDYNDEMIDDEEDDYHENRVIEVRWREALGGFHHLQVAQSGSGLIDVPSEPFEGVNVDDLFGLRRTLGFDRRRQTSRSFDRNNTDGGLQHPLLSRPPQSGDASLWSSAGNVSRDSESLSGAGVDVSQFYMFDTPPFLYDFGPGSVIGDRSGGTAPPPLTDYSVGMDSSQLVGRRGPGDGRWADDGQPQAGNQASAIAQAVEEVFVSVLHGASTTETPVGIQSQNTSQPEQQLDAGQNCDSNLEMEGNPSRDVHGHSEVLLENGETEPQQVISLDIVSNQDSINAQAVTEVAAVHESEPLSSNIAHHSMESEDGNDPSDDLMRIEQEPLPSADPVSDLQHGADIGDLDNLRDDQMEVRVADVSSGTDSQLNNDVNNPDLAMLNQSEHPSVCANPDIEMAGTNEEPVQINQLLPAESNEPVADQNAPVNGNSMESEHVEANAEPSGPNVIDPTFLEALPEDLRAEVLASQQSQPTQPPTYTPPSMEDIDPEFLAALPPEIQAEVLAQQRVQRLAQQSEGQPVDMDNASIIATLPADLREEVLLTSSEAVLSALPSPLLAEAQMLRDRAMSHYQARSLFGSSHRLPNRRNGLGFDRQSVMDRGVGVTIGRRTGAALSDVLKVKEVEGEPLLDGNALKALIRLLRLAQPLGKGLLQRLLLNLCAHSVTRATLIYLLLEMIKPEAEGVAGNISMINPQRLYGCSPNMVHGQSQLLEGLPPLVLRRVLEILNYLATNHSSVANTLFYFEPSLLPDSSQKIAEAKKGKGKEKVGEPGASSNSVQEYEEGCTPLILLLKLLNRPLFRRSIAHVEQVMGLLQVVVYTAASRLESLTPPEQVMGASQNLTDKASDEVEKDVTVVETETSQQNEVENGETSISDKKTGGHNVYDIFTQLPRSDLRNLSRLLGYEGLSDKVYMLAGEVLKKLASVIASHRKFFTQELSDLAQDLSSAAVSELNTLKNTRMMGLGAGSVAGAAMLRVLQALSSLISQSVDGSSCLGNCEEEEQAILLKLNSALEPLWQELSNCISTTELELGQSTLPPIVASMNSEDGVGSTLSSPPLPPGTQRLLPFIESFFVLCEKLQSSSSFVQQDQNNVTAQEVKESADASSSTLSKCGADSQRRFDSAVIFSRFADKHRRLLNAFIRQNPGLLEKSLSMMLKAPRLIDFDNKRAYFRSRIRHQHEQHLAGPLRISVRRAYVLEDSYNQLRMRSNQDLKGRLNVQFQGEEGIDAGGLTREWYQLLSRVIFDKGALLFTTVGNNATFQPNPNSVYQTEHLSYFKFVGRVVAKALFDGQLLDVYFTRSFYKHILGVKVTYHDIEAVDPDYYKNLKWLLENDVNDILDLTFSMDADEEKLILYEKTQVTDYELKPGGRNIRVTEETKHEYVDLVADHILTNAIRPQINSFLEGFNELVPRELISIFNDKELELLISGLPEIDLDDLKVNTEYTGYTVASNVIQWFWEVASSFSKEDMARLLQFVTGTSKVPLEGFKALQGISGPQKFQIHKAYGAPERLPSAHTCFNQLDLPEYSTKEQLRERLLLAIHEASEGFGFG